PSPLRRLWPPVLLSPVAMTVFASTDLGRLFRSVDGGEQWQEIPAWAGLGVVNALALSPSYAKDQTIFAATRSGVFRSFDDGASWESAEFGLLDPEALCIVCAPDYAMSETLWVGTGLGGLFRSRNAARAWRESGQGLPDAAIQAMVIAPTRSSPDGPTSRAIPLVGTEVDGVYLSIDGGSSWSRASDDLAGEFVNSLLVVSSDANEVVLLAGAASGVYRSVDGGAHWKLTTGGEFLALSFGISASGLVVAGAYGDGVFVSEDAGQSWREANQGLDGHAPPLVVRSPGNVLFALDIDGVLAASADGGATWDVASADDTPIRAMTVADDGGDGLLYTASDEGLFCRNAAAGSFDWQSLTLPSAPVAFLQPSPHFQRDRTLLCGDLAGSLFFSHSAGEEWSRLTLAWPSEFLLNAMIGRGENTPFVALSASLNAQANYQVNIWASTDLGQSWAILANLETESPAVLIAMPDDPAARAMFLATRNRIIKLFTEPSSGELSVEQHFWPQAPASRASSPRLTTPSRKRFL
ncbi:MAG: hypothetical protein HC802_21065, partial [Caldilineaceae bacterium]|nr:hypothetical protein [Caldilineaceae bacterium]